MAVIRQDLFFQIFGGGPVAENPSRFLGPVDLGAIVALITKLQYRRVAEFGVGSGANAALLLRDIPSIDKYIGVDVPPGTIPSLAYQASEVPATPGEFALADPRFCLLIRNQGTREVSREDLGVLDFVFIDGDHSPEGVRHDTNLARQTVRPGGAVCWHDYNNAPAIGPQIVIDEINFYEGNHICQIEGTSFCFELR
jgi:predicted O-methyltransferase YrrM